MEKHKFVVIWHDLEEHRAGRGRVSVMGIYESEEAAQLAISEFMKSDITDHWTNAETGLVDAQLKSEWLGDRPEPRDAAGWQELWESVFTDSWAYEVQKVG